MANSCISRCRRSSVHAGEVDRLYLVSSRDPDRYLLDLRRVHGLQCQFASISSLSQGYDMPALLADAFPGVRAHLEATSFLFTGGSRSAVCG